MESEDGWWARARALRHAHWILLAVPYGVLVWRLSTDSSVWIEQRTWKGSLFVPAHSDLFWFGLALVAYVVFPRLGFIDVGRGGLPVPPGCTALLVRAVILALLYVAVIAWAE